MTVFDALLIVAAIAAMAGVITGNIASYALLASNGFTFLLCKTGAQFDPVLWLAVDGLAAGLILALHRHRTDWLILALYAPIVPLYFNWSATAAQITVVLVSVQMFLTLPFGMVKAFWRDARRFNQNFNPWDHLDLRGIAGAPA